MYGARRQFMSIRTVVIILLVACGALGLAVRPGLAEDPAPVGGSVVESPHGDLDLPCQDCHSAAGWIPAVVSSSFEHAEFGFDLTGSHLGVDCALCHTSMDFTGASGDCSACHEDVHSGSFGPDCALCHVPRSFIDRPSQLDSHQLTRFPLNGSHLTLDCDQCHPSASTTTAFVNTPVDCYSCHREQFDSTSSPDHVQAGFDTDCTPCHSTGTWSGGTIGSHDFFSLSGGHGGLQCQDCHTSGSFESLDRNCVACHRTDYDLSTDPNHSNAGFPLACGECHSIASWLGADFDHALTAFALTGAHQTVECLECHVGGVFTGTAGDCYSCHRSDFEVTTNPAHVPAGFDTNCAACHGTASWLGADFDHAITAFALIGAHQTVDCLQCHVGGVFTGTPSDCYACHRPEYDATTNPAHIPAGFNTDCAACHNSVIWEDATFDHDTEWFPLRSGTHAAEWSVCQDCHTNASSYSTFSCMGCHPHSDRAKTDDGHQGEVDYRYDSIACYDCHPRGD